MKLGSHTLGHEERKLIKCIGWYVVVYTWFTVEMEQERGSGECNGSKLEEHNQTGNAIFIQDISFRTLKTEKSTALPAIIGY